MNKLKIFPKSLLAVLCANCFLLPTAIAQQEESEGAADNTEVISVLGSRQQLRAAVAAKVDSNGIADFLGTDDLGKTADLNIADSLRRAPGVNTIFDEDEGRYVSIRGLESNFTYFSFDGSQLASVDRNSRRVNTEMIPSTAVKRLEIYKTQLPEFDGNAIGGTVNLVSRSAYDTVEFFGVVNAQVGYHSYKEVPGGSDSVSPRIDAAFSNTFGDDNEFGIMLAGTYFDKTRDQSRSLSLNHVEQGDGDIRDDRQLPLNYTNTIERRSILSKFEYKPTDEFYTYLSLGHFDYQYDEVRHLSDLNGSGQNESVSGINSGTIDSARAAHQFNTFPLNLTVDNIKAALEYQINDESLLDASLSRSEGTNSEPSFSARFSTDNDTRFGFDYDLAAGVDGIPQVNINDEDAFSNLDNYTLVGDGLQFNLFVQEEVVDEFKVNYAYNDDRDAEGWGFKTGVKLRTLEKSFDNSSERYTYTPGNLTGGQFQLATFKTPGHGFNVPIFDVDATRSFFDANRADFTVNRPDGANVGSDFFVEEVVNAAYIQGVFNSDQWNVIGGLRYEKTDLDTRSFVNSSGDYSEVNRSSSYSNVLPSFVASYNLDDERKIRFAASQAVGRPNFPDIARGESLSFSASDTEITEVTLTKGNPNLKPRKSTNLDLAFDWHLDTGKFFSAAIFHKDLKDQIYSLSTTLNNADDLGITLPLPVANSALIEVSQAQNVADASIQGIELSYTDDSFSFAPDFGMATNVTFIDGEGDVVAGDASSRKVGLLEQPEMLFNFSLLYNTEVIEMRLSFNHTGEYLEVINTGDATGNRDRIVDSYNQVDLGARYIVSEALSVTFEGRNIFDKERTKTVGSSRQEINQFGNSWWLGVAYKL